MVVQIFLNCFAVVVCITQSPCLVGHMVFSLLTGAFSIFGFLGYLGSAITYICVFILTFGGHEVKLSESAKEQTIEIRRKAEEIYKDKKDEAAEYIRRERAKLEKRLLDEREKATSEVKRKLGSRCGAGALGERQAQRPAWQRAGRVERRETAETRHQKERRTRKMSTEQRHRS